VVLRVVQSQNTAKSRHPSSLVHQYTTATFIIMNITCRGTSSNDDMTWCHLEHSYAWSWSWAAEQNWAVASQAQQCAARSMSRARSVKVSLAGGTGRAEGGKKTNTPLLNTFRSLCT